MAVESEATAREIVFVPSTVVSDGVKYENTSDPSVDRKFCLRTSKSTSSLAISSFSSCVLPFNALCFRLRRLFAAILIFSSTSSSNSTKYEILAEADFVLDGMITVTVSRSSGVADMGIDFGRVDAYVGE